MQEKKEPNWYHAGQRPDESKLIEAIMLYDAGWTLKELGKKFNRSKSNMWYWINIFAPEIGHPSMRKKGIRSGKGKAKGQRMTGTITPETTPKTTPQATQPSIFSSKEESSEEKIKRLEKELAEARLARDFYNEMINVAERQFSIDIRKKAGTRQ